MQPLIQRVGQVARQGVRNCSIQRLTITPPQNRMSLAEKAAHGIVLSLSILAIPAWVLVHVKEYRGNN